MKRATLQLSAILGIFALLFCLNAAADELNPIILGDEPEPDIDLTFEGHTGYIVSPISIFILNPYERPWRIGITGGDLVHQDTPDQRVPSSRVQYRDTKAGTAWTGYGGLITNPGGQPHMKIEMRIELTGTEAPGYYVGDAVLNWLVWPGTYPGAEPLTGTLTLRLHLNIPEVVSVSIEPEAMTFPEHTGDFEGWIYSENQPTMTVKSNQDFYLTISTGEDLTTANNGSEHQLPFAMRLWMPKEGTPTWQTWGDLGGDEHGQAQHPWAEGVRNDHSPWPGLVRLIQTTGTNLIGLEGAAWRSGLYDPVGDYTSTIVFTISLP